MSSDGVISYFDTRLPTADEINTLTRVEMASPIPWDPKSIHFTQAEENAELNPRRRNRVASIGYVSRGYEDVIQPNQQLLPRTVFHVAVSHLHMASADIMVAQEPSMLLDRLGINPAPSESRECSSLETRPLHSLLLGTGSGAIGPELRSVDQELQ
jgi:hypothetical protein